MGYREGVSESSADVEQVVVQHASGGALRAGWLLGWDPGDISHASWLLRWDPVLRNVLEQEERRGRLLR